MIVHWICFNSEERDREAAKQLYKQMMEEEKKKMMSQRSVEEDDEVSIWNDALTSPGFFPCSCVVMGFPKL